MKTCESCHYGDMAFTAEAFSDKCGPLWEDGWAEKESNG